MKLQQARLVTLVSIGGAVVAYVVLLFLPQHRQIRALGAELDAKTQYVQQAETLGAGLQAVKADAAVAKSVVEKWRLDAPDGEELSALFTRINALIKSSGASTTRFDPDPPIRRSAIAEIPLAIGLSGSFAQIQTFLGGLESLPEEIWVISASITAMPKDGDMAVGEISLVVFVSNPGNSDYVRHTGGPIN